MKYVILAGVYIFCVKPGNQGASRSPFIGTFSSCSIFKHYLFDKTKNDFLGNLQFYFILLVDFQMLRKFGDNLL